MCLPAEEPAQEPAPAVDEAACFVLVPAAPMHTIAEASPGSTSETVVGAVEHAVVVSLYPYDLQPAQDAPAEPVAEAGVPEERAEVPQPRQWTDEGGLDSRAVFMPVSEVVPAAATIARRHLEHPDAHAQSTRILRSAACCSHEAWRASERTGIRVRGLGGLSIGSADSEASYRRDAERSDGGTREGHHAKRTRRVSSPALRLRYRMRWTGRIAACAEVRSVRDVPRTPAVHPAAVLTRLRGGVTSSVARESVLPQLRKSSHDLLSRLDLEVDSSRQIFWN
ncbi:hypothetical protein FB451DRAFT_1190080 [Mycena latifolia]|nr:hypothetical protein FB451DRAFT_1190080 [Mycena latifolia]